MIARALDEHYAKREAAREREPFRFRPSNLAGCMRQAAFMLMGMEGDPPAPESLRTFELGHQRGAALEEAAKEIWPDARSQVPISIMAGRRVVSPAPHTNRGRITTGSNPSVPAARTSCSACAFVDE